MPRLAKDPKERFWSYVLELGPDDCWPWLGCITTAENGRGGYGAFTGNWMGKKHEVHNAHRWAYVISHNIPFDSIKGLVILHSCDVRLCCNPNHLSQGTTKDNAQDMVAKLRFKKDKNGQVLNPEKVKEIRDRYSTGFYNYVELGLMFNVHPATILRVISRKLWYWVT